MTRWSKAWPGTNSVVETKNLEIPPEKLLEEVFQEDPEPTEIPTPKRRAPNPVERSLWKPSSPKQQDVALAIIILVSVIGICMLSSILSRLSILENEVKILFRV